MSQAAQVARRFERGSRLAWVPIRLLTVFPSAVTQRRFKPKWVSEHTAIFDPDSLGFLVVAHHDGKYFIIDGQHRVALLRAVGWGDQQIQCELFDTPTAADMAKLFLGRADQINIRTFDEFRINITAEDPVAVAIDQIVRRCGLSLADAGGSEGRISAVKALMAVYDMEGGAQILAHTLSVLASAWGRASAAFAGDLIEGLGLFFSRYDSKADSAALTQRLAGFAGGPTGLLGRARSLRDIRGGRVACCVAAVMVEAYNRARRQHKLEDWWK